VKYGLIFVRAECAQGHDALRTPDPECAECMAFVHARATATMQCNARRRRDAIKIVSRRTLQLAADDDD
jgi:hypothetical protein